MFNNVTIYWLSLYVKVTNLSFASEQMHAAELSQLRRRRAYMSSDDFDRQRGIAKSITVSISETRTPDVDTEEMSINRRSPSLMSTSVGVDHP